MTQYLRINPTDREIQLAINELMRGRSNNVGSVSLATSSTTTTVNDPIVHEESYIDFMPLSLTAAAELAAGTMYVSSRSAGSFVITHSISILTRSFDYVAVG